MLLLAILPAVVASKATFCTEDQRTCKPSCETSNQKDAGRRDALGNLHIMPGKLCKMCRCQACAFCSESHSYDAVHVIQHPGPFMKAGVRRVAKQTTRMVGVSKSKHRAIEVNESTSAVGNMAHWPNSRRKASFRRRKPGNGKLGTVGGDDGRGKSNPKRSWEPPPPMADLFGQILLALALCGAAIVGGTMLCNIVKHSRRGIEVDEDRMTTPGPVHSAQGSP